LAETGPSTLVRQSGAAITGSFDNGAAAVVGFEGSFDNTDAKPAGSWAEIPSKNAKLDAVSEVSPTALL
jgi:hypothetical protein